MCKPSTTSQPLAVQPVYRAASALNSLIRALPAGSAYFIGIVLITLCTGPLVHHRGSLARAALPYVVHLRWGWHRVARARERGKGSLDALCDRAFTWGFEGWPVEPVRWGSERRSVPAIDSSTVVRRRANQARCARLGKGYCQRAHRAVPANRVAALTTAVLIRGLRVGVVRRTRFGARCHEAVAQVFAALPESPAKRVFRVDAGSATSEPLRAAPLRDARVGRWRKNVTLRRAPHPQRPGRRGRPARHGPVRPPGAQRPEGRPDEDPTLRIEDRAGRVRRGRKRHCRETPRTALEVVRVDDPAYQRPLVLGTTAREVTTDESRIAYGHRWPVETNFSVAQGTCAMERPRAWSETAVERRLSLALLAGSLLQASAAACGPLPMGPWDLKAVSSAGRVANHLAIQAGNFVALALTGLVPRTYRKIPEAKETTELQLPLAA